MVFIVYSTEWSVQGFIYRSMHRSHMQDPPVGCLPLPIFKGLSAILTTAPNAA